MTKPPSKRRVSPLAVLRGRYPDLETKDFIPRVRAALVRVASEYRADNREISATIGQRVSSRLRPQAFRIVRGPHEDWGDHVRLVYVYLITPDGLPSQAQVANFTALWWELDSTETHELVIVLVDRDGRETPMDTPSLAIGLMGARYGPHAQPEDV